MPAGLPAIATEAGTAGLAALLADPGHALVALDFDGTLSPIVADPAQARPLPGAAEATFALARRVATVAVITGRPAEVVVERTGWGRGPRAGHAGRLLVLGQYGLERWDAATHAVTRPAPPPGLATARRELAGVLAAAGVPDAHVEDKGLALAVHVRRAAAPEQAMYRLREPLRALAVRAGLALEPGRLVLELRPPGMDKGAALTALLRERAAASVLVAGDDLGDLAAFAAVADWRRAGHHGLIVWAGSGEVPTPEPGDPAAPDIVVPGPAGVLALLRRLIGALPEPSGD